MRNIGLIILAFTLSMCQTNQQILPSANTLAPLIIYKTTKDYSKNLPLVMNDAKDKIVSYPDVSDVSKRGEITTAIQLREKFLLDEFGLSKNSVYTSYTYEEYAKLKETPRIEELMNSIIDKEPFTAMYNCGIRNNFKTTKELNGFIKEQLDNSQKLK